MRLLTPLLLIIITAPAAPAAELPTADGFRGIWYMNQPTKDEYRYKYSGGFATYPQQHSPIAIYSAKAGKTFFVYGGRTAEKNELLHMVSFYDHATGTVARPRVLLNKQTSDAHDNPVMQIDDAGHIWVFSNSHGTSRPSFIHRSTRPFDITRFDLVRTTNFSYGRAHYITGTGFVFLHTLYEKGHRVLHVAHSPDGVTWSDPRKLAHVEQGHYAISAVRGRTIGVAMNFHPTKGGLNARTNLYYIQSDDAGKTWRTAAGVGLTPPLTVRDNPALAVEYQSRGRLVYLKDIGLDEDNRPVVLYETSGGYEPGPASGPRMYTTARWTGAKWEVNDFRGVDHNYDFGSLYLEAGGAWRFIGVTEPGPQPWSTGGEITMWLTTDRGADWKKLTDVTKGSTFNHNYPRRPLDAHDDFYALWADGNALEPSESRLYFCTRDGRAFRLPATMTGQTAKPQPIE